MSTTVKEESIDIDDGGEVDPLSLLSVGIDDDPGSHGADTAKKQKLEKDTKMAPKQQQLQVQRGASGGMACPFCKTMFPSEAEFVEHLTKAHNSKVLMKCKDCDFKAKTGEEIRSHREEEHNQPKQTSDHPKSSVAETVEKGIDESIRGPKVVEERPSIDIGNEAPSNETKGSNKSAPRQQQLQVKSGASGATMCPFCKLMFPAEAEFVDHLTKVHNSKVLMKCKDCDFKAQTGEEIRSHREQEHSQPKLTPDQPKLSMGNGADDPTLGPKVMEERPFIDVGDEAKVHKNPNLSSSELITEAMLNGNKWSNQGRMPLHDIYKCISQKYPYFKPSNQRWKKCIAQALNNNPCFEKVAGSKILWRLVPEGENVGDGDLQDDGGEKCDVCMASLGFGKTLLEHYREQHVLQQLTVGSTHAGNVEVKCDECGCLVQASFLQRHKSRVHGPSKEDQDPYVVECGHCGQLNYDRAKLEAHVRVCAFATIDSKDSRKRLLDDWADS